MVMAAPPGVHSISATPRREGSVQFYRAPFDPLSGRTLEDAFDLLVLGAGDTTEIRFVDGEEREGGLRDDGLA
jgi:hypothetical protein